MPAPPSLPRTHRTALARRLALWLCLIALSAWPLLGAPAQDRADQPLRLGGVRPSGARNSVTEAWTAFTFDLTNLSDRDRQARVLMFYSTRPDVQYGRDVWVPARSIMNSWMLVGPAPPGPSPFSRDIQMLLYDRTDGKDQLILPPTQERVRARPVNYQKREPTTAVLVDEEPPQPEWHTGELPRPDSKMDEALRLARTFRGARDLSATLPMVHPGAMPATAEALDGIDHFVVASPRLAEDAAGLRALRHWLQRGGKVWVMLDLVDPEVVAPLLGDALDFELVDRVSLTDFKVESQGTARPLSEVQIQRYERPVDFARVLLPPNETVRHTIVLGGAPGTPGTGWPVWFSRPVGQGKVVFTTLGARGWSRPRILPVAPVAPAGAPAMAPPGAPNQPRVPAPNPPAPNPPRVGGPGAPGRPGQPATDPPSPFENFSNLPVALPHLEVLGDELQPQGEQTPFKVEAFEKLLTDEIGYSVPARGTVGVVFAAFLLAVLALGLLLRKSRRPEILGWLGPAAALAAAAVFVTLGESSRRRVPPTVAVAQVVDAVPATGEVSVRGLLAMYRPDSGPAEPGARNGGLFELDFSGVEGQSRRLLLTDTDAWHWDGLELPAGVRQAAFRTNATTGEPVRAVARFGPAGIEGKLTAGPFRGAADAVLHAPGGRPIAVRLKPDGTFTAGPDDVLPQDQYIAGTLLSDRQQRQQDVYRDLLQRQRPDGRLSLFAWTEPLDAGFSLVPDARSAGAALLSVPLELERAAPGTQVTIPAPMVSYRRIINGVPTRPLMEAGQAAEMHLRFQLPPAALPLKVERAILVAKAEAPGRRVSAGGRPPGADDLAAVDPKTFDSPLDPILVEITREEALRLDEQGGLHVNLAVSGPIAGQGKSRLKDSEEKWTIRYIELEVAGRTPAGE